MSENTRIENVNPREHARQDEAVASFWSMFNTVKKNTDTRGWLAVVFEVDADGKVHLHRTTWQFPTDAWGIAVNLLKEAAMADRPTQNEPAPLPIAANFGIVDESTIQNQGNSNGTVEFKE